MKAQDIHDFETRWKSARAMAGHRAALLGGGRRPAARLGDHRVHAGAARRRASLAPAAHRAVHPRAGRPDRQPGGADGAGRAEGHLRERLAGGGRHEHRRPDLSRPEPLPGRQRADAGAADQQRAAARRPDHARRRQRASRCPYWFAPDRRRRRGRLRRRAERLRADEGDDRGGRRRRPLRGPAVVGEEVRAHGRQGAGAHAARPSRSWSRRGWPPTCCGVPTMLIARTDADGANLLDQRHRRARPAVPAPASARSKASSACAPGIEQAIARGARLRALRRPDLVRDLAARPGRGTRASPRAIHAQFPGKLLAYNCSPSFNWKQHSRTRPDRALPARAGERWATSSSSSRWPASTPST